MLNENVYVLLGDYINAAVNVGFRISTVEEPMLPHNWKSASLFCYENYIETPTYLILIEVLDKLKLNVTICEQDRTERSYEQRPWETMAAIIIYGPCICRLDKKFYTIMNL